MQMGLGNRFQGEKYPPGFQMGSWRGTEEVFLLLETVFDAEATEISDRFSIFTLPQ